MDITELVKLVTESGMGVLSFAALIYGGWKLLMWLEEIKSNHLVHLQGSLDKLTENSTEANKKLDEQNKILERVDKNTTK